MNSNCGELRQDTLHTANSGLFGGAGGGILLNLLKEQLPTKFTPSLHVGVGTSWHS